MNQGQQMVFNFIMARVQDGKQAEARALLEEGFQRRAHGTFTAEQLQGLTTKMLALLKPEHVSEVKALVSQFGPSFISKP